MVKSKNASVFIPVNDQFTVAVETALPIGRHSLQADKLELLKLFYFLGYRAAMMATVMDPDGRDQSEEEITDNLKKTVKELDAYFGSRSTPAKK